MAKTVGLIFPATPVKKGKSAEKADDKGKKDESAEKADDKGKKDEE